MSKRKICVVTGTRAEYGLLFWLLKELQADKEIELQVIATGTHLATEFGLTYKIIENDGFKISAKVEIPLSSGAPLEVAKAMGVGTIGFAESLEKLKPDIMVVLGDRYELLSAAQAAMVLQIPIAHIHGGETTEGAIDEAIRHSITKMSQFHFVAADPYRRRVIQLGENPESVYCVGALGLEYVRRAALLTKTEFERQIDFKLGQTNFMVTYHPVTLQKEGPEKAVSALLGALDEFPEAKIIFTKGNSDTFGDRVNAMIQAYANKNSDRAHVYTSLGSPLYLSAIRIVDVVIGNSSSGIIEAPALGCPTVNIGLRQQGRLKATSVIDCDDNQVSIVAAIRRAISKDFKESAANSKSLYGDGDSAAEIKETLKRVKLDGILIKKFFDLEGPNR